MAGSGISTAYFFFKPEGVTFVGVEKFVRPVRLERPIR